MIDYLKSESAGKTLKELQKSLKLEFDIDLTTKQIESAKYRHNIKSYKKRGQYKQIFDEEVQAFILRNYKGIRKIDMLAQLKKEFCQEFTPAQLENFYSHRNIVSGVDMRYKSGEEHPNYLLIGSERTDCKKRKWIKVIRDNKSKWMKKSHVVWEEKNGEIPTGFALKYLDGDETNWKLENLVLLDVNTSNSLATQQLSTDIELNRVIINVARLKVLINKRTNKRKDYATKEEQG
ncbi:HNH endonuclease [Enterococcus sp. BWB1-3]|uniref:HNH endonuclease n=1 Tax=Enterococcus sp. BWB1-3 TaxID=2787713 RepID=UPI001923D769|nr:HNH endonuclease [Enterococcus sp. BWB1-3]MBL1228163.1 HNH endonuclease [Enterococcus sp. BWB1-3]